MNPHAVTKEFERQLCAYTGAPYAVAVNSCTMALLLAVAWHLRDTVYSRRVCPDTDRDEWFDEIIPPPAIEIPKRTYVGVPMSIIHAGGRPAFREQNWRSMYQLEPLPVFDSARLFTSGMYLRSGSMLCVSFHAAKILGDTQGGAILHDNPEADYWLRRARFDGRQEGVEPKHQVQAAWVLGWHCYLSPDVSARLLWKLSTLPKHNEPLPWGPGTDSDYPDLSQLEIFK